MDDNKSELINSENKEIVIRPNPPKKTGFLLKRNSVRSLRFKTNKNDIWIKFFLKNFNLIKYHHLVIIEGFKIIEKLFILKKIKGDKINLFFNEGWFKLLVSCNNKFELLSSFEYYYDLISNKNKPLYRSLKKIKSINNKEVKLFSYNKKLWIAFGINQYDNWVNLNNAVNDAKCLTEFCKNFKFDTQIFTDGQVTKRSIELMFKSYLFKNSSYNDLIVVSFHGHGHTIEIDNSSYGFFVPYDAPLKCTPGDLISTNDISSWCKYIKSRHILLLFDCCFSGHSVLRSNEKNNSRKYSINTIDIFLNKKARIAINAGTDDQKVADDGWNNNSVFTGCIMSYPGFYDNFGSALNLYSYLLENVPKYCSQTPTIGKLLGDQGGDIFLAL